MPLSGQVTLFCSIASGFDVLQSAMPHHVSITEPEPCSNLNPRKLPSTSSHVATAAMVFDSGRERNSVLESVAT